MRTETESPSLAATGEGLKRQSMDSQEEPQTCAAAGQSVNDRALSWAARTSGRPDASADADATAPAGRSALPCQNSNNSPKRAYVRRQVASVIVGRVGCANVVTLKAESGETMDRDGRCWKAVDGRTFERIAGGITSAEAKRAFALRRNVEAFAEHYRHEHCGFMTLTPLRGDMTPGEMGRAWDDMRKHRLKWVRAYVRVLEPQKRDAPHHHNFVSTPFDLRPGQFDWAALQGAAEARARGDIAEAKRLTRQYAQSAPECLRECWHELREACAHYGLGRSEFLPLRKEAGAVANYIGKYLEAGLVYRRDEWKGARRVEYSRADSARWKRCASSFGWLSTGARAWRSRVAEMAHAIGASTPEQLARKLGSRWAYHLRSSIVTATEDQWREFLMYLVNEYGGRMERKPLLKSGAEVLQWYPGSDDLVDAPF